MDNKAILEEAAKFINAEAEALKASHSIPGTGILSDPIILAEYNYEKELALRVRIISEGM